MEQLKKDELIEEYREAYAAIPQEILDLDIRITVRTMQALAKGKPVSPDQLAKIWEMPLAHVKAVLDQATGRVEIDSQGRLIGGVLSLNPTPHRISMNGEQLFAWCAYDAIYAPGVVGKTAQIDSQDPITGDSIRVTITPDGVVDAQPEGTVVSVVGGKMDMRGGPESPRCTQMLFFGSRDSAHQWLQGRADVSILTVEEVFEIARQFQIEPARRLGLV
ncbi:MAG: alkylmercury lyase [Anaerolineales bacterium]|nr:alkylmercury lyase [Anaerolineales bacterium]